MLDLDVQPARSLGNEFWEFILGMPLYQAIALIKSQDDYMKNVQVLHNQQNVLANDILVDLTLDCIRLHFDAYLQRLKVIEVYDMSKVKLKYFNEYFNSPSILPTIAQIDNCFGATHPAKYNADRTFFCLNFRGLTFNFKIIDGSDYETIHVEKFGCVEYPTHTSPIVSNLFIYSGPSLYSALVPSIPLSCIYGGLYLEKLELVHNKLSDSFTFQFHLISDGDRLQAMNEASLHSSSRYVTLVQEVNFGDTTQDVISKIGSPCRMHYKDDDKMKIHSSKGLKTFFNSSDYFFNYFNYGVDILFDARTHVVKKFVLHTNFPNHYNFNMYHRCHFHIPLSISMHPNLDVDELLSDNQFNITFDIKWSSMEKYFVTPHTKPVILNRTYDNNPFGSTYCFGYHQFIFEVMSCDQIASITIYQSSRKN